MPGEQQHPPYVVLEHTADVGIRAYGQTLAELFANAAHGMASLALGGGASEPEPISETEYIPLSESAADIEQLLVNWLSDILYRMDAEGWAFTRFDVQHCDGNSASGTGIGKRRDVASRTRSVAIKAVTYHQLSVTQSPDGWEATVYFDI